MDDDCIQNIGKSVISDLYLNHKTVVIQLIKIVTSNQGL